MSKRFRRFVMTGSSSEQSSSTDDATNLGCPYSRRDVAPYLSEAYVQSLAFGSASYGAYVKQVHPRVVSSIKQSHGFYVSHIDPAVRRVYALYLRPQVDKVLAKVFGHRAHALGSDALKNTTSEVKQSRQHAKELKKERVAEAVRSSARNGAEYPDSLS